MEKPGEMQIIQMVVNWDFWNLAMKALLWEDQGTQWENALAVESTGVKKKKKKKLQQLNIRSRNVKCDLSIDLPSYQSTYLSIYQSINHLSTYLLYLPTYCLICREIFSGSTSPSTDEWTQGRQTGLSRKWRVPA